MHDKSQTTRMPLKKKMNLTINTDLDNTKKRKNIFTIRSIAASDKSGGGGGYENVKN